MNTARKNLSHSSQSRDFAKETKAYLNQVFLYDKEITKLCEKLEYIRYKQTSPSSSFFSHTKTQHSPSGGGIDELLVRALEVEEELSCALLALSDLEAKIYELVESLSSPMQKAILIWRYICRKPWADVAESADLSEMHALRIHNKALAELAEISLCHKASF